MSRAGRNRRLRAGLVASLIALSACGGSTAEPGESAEPTAPSTTSPVAAAATDAAEATTSSAPTQADQWADVFPEIELDPTEPGPRPVLSWAPVEDAALYQLTVLDSDSVPYWAWSGTDTSVPLGGMENPDAIGAWVFEELSWMVVARSSEGDPLGMSRRATLQP